MNLLSLLLVMHCMVSMISFQVSTLAGLPKNLDLYLCSIPQLELANNVSSLKNVWTLYKSFKGKYNMLLSN